MKNAFKLLICILISHNLLADEKINLRQMDNQFKINKLEIKDVEASIFVSNSTNENVTISFEGQNIQDAALHAQLNSSKGKLCINGKSANFSENPKLKINIQAPKHLLMNIKLIGDSSFKAGEIASFFEFKSKGDVSVEIDNLVANSKFKTKGTFQAKIHKINSNLKLHSKGDSKWSISSGIIPILDFKVTGQNEFDFSNGTVTNASFEIDGEANVKIDKITGKLLRKKIKGKFEIAHNGASS